MPSIFDKLNYKGQEKLHVIDPPETFEIHLKSIQDHANVIRGFKQTPMQFVLAFVTTKHGVEKLAGKLEGKIEGDCFLWVAYPKKSSRNFQSDISRDDGWQPFGNLGFEAVRMVAIDEDWSALRLRRVAFIKKLKRNSKMIMSKEGKKRVGKGD